MTHISLKAQPCSPGPMPWYRCSFPAPRCLPTQPGGKPRCWRKAQVLLVGAILTPGQRTVAAARRVMGRSDQQDYARYHEVLNRAVWSPREAAHILLLLQHLDHSDGPLICGIRAFYQSRNPGTASRSADQRSGHLPGRGAFQLQPRGQGQRSARDFSAVAGPGTLGRTPFP